MVPHSLLLIKPGSLFSEPLHGFCRYRESVRAEVITKKVKPFLNAPDERLVGVFLQTKDNQMYAASMTELRASSVGI
jgi:hypothetical protein